MSSEPCQRCAELEQELARTLRELERARRDLEKAQRMARRLLGRLRAALAACQWWQEQAEKTLRQRGGVPRGTWAFARGAHKAAAHVAAVLMKDGEQ